jgi:hypothetical protein
MIYPLPRSAQFSLRKFRPETIAPVFPGSGSEKPELPEQHEKPVQKPKWRYLSGK